MKIQEINAGQETQTKKQMKSKKKVKRSFLWLKFLLVTVLFLSTLVFIALSPIFNIGRIEVGGSQRYTQEEIIGASNVIIGSNGFKTIGSSIENITSFRYGRAEESILKKFPYIKSAKVRYLLPGTVKIELTERHPVAAIPYIGTNLVIDDEKFVVDTIDEVKGSDLIMFKGAKIEHYEVGQELKPVVPEALDSAMQLVKAIEESDGNAKVKIASLIRFVDVSDLNKVCLNIDSRIMVNLGDLRDLNYRIDFMKQILTKSLKKEDRGYLDFTTGENPNFIPEKPN